MKIIVVGCGKIGSSIIGDLVSEGHDIVAVDEKADVAESMGNIYEVMSVCGNGADCETLSEAGAERADMLIACTDSDEMNMLSCFIASKMGVGHTVARIRNPEYNDKNLPFLKSAIGLSLTLNPEMLAAKELYNILKLPAAANIETFNGNLEMIELNLKPDMPLCGSTLMELRRKYNAKFLICAVRRGETVHIPNGNFALESGDRIGLTAPPTEIQKLLKLMGVSRKQARSVMILGGSRTAYYLAKLLIAGGNTVRIIDRDEERCRQLAAELPEAVLIHGDGAEQELLLEEGLESVDAFVALTGMDEENILISIFAANKRVPKVVAKVNRPELAAMARNLGLECLISPRKSVSDLTTSYVRALENSAGSRIETLYKLMDSGVEALEFLAAPDFPGLKTPLKELQLKPNMIIAGIARGRRANIPTGDDVIEAGDRVIVIVADQQLSDLSDILQQ